MLETLVHLIASPLVRLWLGNSGYSWRLLPTPSGRPIVHSNGANSDRVLLVGSGVAVGYGVRSADLALGGHLARQLSELTDRGTSIDIVAQLGMRISGCAAAIEHLDLARFDALVITLGTDEALNLVPTRQFRRDLNALMDHIDLNAPLSMSVVFVGIPDIPTIMKLPTVLAGLVGRRSERLDEQLKRACADHPRAIYLPFTPPEGDLLRSGNRHTYARWAALIAPAVARILDTQLSNPRDPATIVERARQLALDDLRILDTAPDERFDRIVASARDLFGVAGASILFIDRDRQWTKASTGIDPMDTPRGSSLGDATVNNGKMFVVTDASLDDRFSGHPWVSGRSGVRFFAGFPIEASNGQRVGALCIVDPAPRAFSELEGSLLGQLARQVQTDLWASRTPVR